MSFYSLLGRPDPAPWLLVSDEPAARWVTLTRLLRPGVGVGPGTAGSSSAAASSDEAAVVRESVVQDPRTRALLTLLPDWELDNGVTGHDKPLLATNLLDLLGEIGIRAQDDTRIGRLLDQMLAHTDEDGRFQMFSAERGGSSPRWGALLCDTHAITDVLLRFGRGDDPRTRRALLTAISDLQPTSQGLAWPCRPPSSSRWRGPGRAADCCPQTTLEALHAFCWLPATEQPWQVVEAARTVLAVWRSRATQKPYMFGHGRQFKQVKWPPTWYGSYEVVDTIGRLPQIWDGADSRPEDRTALAEIAACLLAYNVAGDATVTPLSTFKGFESHSFGQKTRPSPLATALVWAALKRLEPLAREIGSIDVTALGSSKGGTGKPLPPKIASARE